MADRHAAGRQAALLQCGRDRSDMLKQAALRQQDTDDNRLDRRPGQGAAAGKLQSQPGRRRDADQHDDGNDTPLIPAAFAALRPVEPALEKRNRAAGQHDGVRHAPEHRRHVAERRIDNNSGKQEEQRVARHRGANLGRAAPRINRQENQE
jgi:hypothetical protein